MASEGKQVLVQGRIVWCSGKTVFDGAARKDATGRPILKDDGQPAMQYGFGLAVPKPGPQSTPQEVENFGQIWNAIQSEAMALYPTGQVPPGFSFKYKDGDGIDHKGQPFANREGYRGCLVFALTTSLPLKFFRYEGGAYVQVSDGIKCGDYVQVQVNVKGHMPKLGTQGKPGLYLNPNLTCFLGYGKEIVNAPDAASVFGAAPPPMPSGASATPVGGPANFASFGQPQPEQASQGIGGFTQPPQQQAPQAVPAWNGQQNQQVLPPQFQQAPQAAPAPAWGQPAQQPQQTNGAPPPWNQGR